MANVLSMADSAAILGLWRRGWSQRRIARETGIHRETVGRYIRRAQQGGSDDGQSKPAISTPGSVRDRPEPDGSKPANAPTGSDPPKPAISTLGSAGRRSLCDPLSEIIVPMVEVGLSAQRIWQDLRADQAFTGSYQSVKRYVRHLKAIAPLPFRRMECEPGAEAQVDFGTGAPVVTPDGQPLPVGMKSRRRKTHVFRIVLSHSRKAYSESVYRQTTEDFIRCLENAFWHFGGVPRTLVIDNLRAAVKRADWFDPELNPKILSFCEHYGIVILPTRPRTPRHKGKVERNVAYVQDNALKGRSFSSLADENRHLLDWESQVADTRIHGTTRQQVKKAFELERSALLPLPAERFPFFHEGRRHVNRDGHVEVDKSYYSVPPEYLGREVWARWDSRVVRVFNCRFEQIAIHAKREPGRFSTQDRHIDPKKRNGIERGAAWLLNKTSHIGPYAGRWAEQMVQQRGIEGVRVLQGLLSLAGRHPGHVIEQACETALTHGAYRLRTLRELIKRQGEPQERFEFIDEHPIIRSLGEYGELVRAALPDSGETSSAGFPEPLPWASFPSALGAEAVTE